jgi:hypothetical protein
MDNKTIRQDILIFLISFFGLIGASIAFLTLISLIIAIQL